MVRVPLPTQHQTPFQILANATFKLQSALGEQLTPAITAATRGLSDFIEATADLISRVSDSSEVLEGVTTGVKDLDTTLSNTTSFEARNTAVEQYIGVLESAQTQLQADHRFRA